MGRTNGLSGVVPVVALIVAFVVTASGTPIAVAEDVVTDETMETRTGAATTTTHRYLELRVAGRHAEAYAMLAPSFAEQLLETSFTARSSEFAARTGALRGIEVRGTTWHDAAPEDGRPDTVAVDLRATYAEPVLVCGYLVWSMVGTDPALRREELGVVEGAAIDGMTAAERGTAYARMGCR